MRQANIPNPLSPNSSQLHRHAQARSAGELLRALL
jgi:hypothetical protein